MLEILKKWDLELFVFLNNLGIEQYDGFWLSITRIDTWIPLIVFLTLLLFYYYKFKNGAVLFGFIAFTFGITLLITDAAKEIVSRIRPNNVEELSEYIRILVAPTTFSFFSGHASSSFAIATFVVLALRKHTKWIYLVYIWPILFVLSRIYVGVHYPSDILTGALVGSLLAFIFYRLFRALEEKFNLNDSRNSEAIADREHNSF